jgi:hypothetical protein
MRPPLEKRRPFSDLAATFCFPFGSRGEGDREVALLYNASWSLT